MDEVEELRRQVDKLKSAKQSCQHAEGTLKNCGERNLLHDGRATFAVFTVDLNGTVIAMNSKMCELFSFSIKGGTMPQNLLDCQAMVLSGISHDIQYCIDRKKPVVAERPYTNSQNDDLYLGYSLSPVIISGGVITGVMGIIEEYTGLRREMAALRESERRYRMLFQSAPICMIEWDVSHLKCYLDQLRDSGVSDFPSYFAKYPQEVHHCWELIETADFNHAFLDLMGISVGAIPEGNFLPTDAKEFLEMAREVILLAADGKAAVEREFPIVTTSGEAKIVLGKSLAVTGHEGTLERVAIAMLDISQRKKAEAALRESERRFREQAFRDGLTGLYNQRYLYQSLEKMINSAKSTKTPVSLLFMDMDHFKKVVDTYGHLNGSRAIYEVAQNIRSCLKAPEYAVAYAGDEFVVVLPGMSPDQAYKKASEIRRKVRETIYQLEEGIEVRLTASFGVATFPNHATDIHGLIAAADHALFAIKDSGKDAIGHFPLQCHCDGQSSTC